MPLCRLWSPHTLREVALVQVPSWHEVAAAHFSHNGSLLFLLLADPQHSLAVYFHVNLALQGQLGEYVSTHSPSGLPLLHVTHVTPCTRSLLNGLTLEPTPKTARQSHFKRGRSQWCWTKSGSLWSTNKGSEILAENATKCGSNEGLHIRLATFGLGHLRVWNINSERFSQPPSYKSLCISRLGGDGVQNGQPEATACAFLASGDIITALADRRIVVFRGLAPLRSVSLPSFCSRVVFLQLVQRSLLLLVAQEGLVQLLPLTSLTSTGSGFQALSGSSAGAQPELPKSVEKLTTRTRTPPASCLPQTATVNQPARCRSQSDSHSMTSRTISRCRSPAPKSTATTPPFATGSVHAPRRTPRSTYGDSVGRWYSGSRRRLRPLSAAGSRGKTQRPEKSSLHRSPSAVSRTSTRSSVGRNTRKAEMQQQQQRQRLQGRHKYPSHGYAAILSLRELHPKRCLNIQQVALRHIKSGRTDAASAWLPLHSSQVAAVYWSEPLLLLCTRTQVLVMDALQLSAETSLVLQERPLGSLDVSAVLPLPSSPAVALGYSQQTAGCAHPPAAPSRQLQEGCPCLIVMGGRCCVGGELRLWDLRSPNMSSKRLCGH